ncbi:hypothetical protein WISP_122961 [Willisornis vidua]|uniref:Uncharacterized protein n=1 Tax=Willisornis vidua TaxID=1566151 RepID=A0ABQ9CXW6_9PASS|nr:hypothetical protein WISP_122961 [Willisornis vidua]
MPFVEIKANNVSVKKMRTHENLCETSTKQEMLRGAALKVRVKSERRLGWDTEEKTPDTDITWTMGRMGIIFRATGKEEDYSQKKKRQDSSFLAKKIAINLQDKSRYNSNDGLFSRGIVGKVSFTTLEKSRDCQLVYVAHTHNVYYTRLFYGAFQRSTKISVYRAIVLSALLYESESRVIYRHHLWLLKHFHQRCLRTIHWTDYMTNVSVLEQAGVSSMEAMLMRTELRWAGHVSRMGDHRLPKIVLYGELATGCRKRGAPKKRYKDSLKQHLSLGHIDCHQWSTLASSRDSWRHTIHDAASSFENARRVSLEEKRKQRKNHVLPIPPGGDFLLCLLQPDLPIPHQPFKPPVHLQQAWGVPFSNLCS